MSVDIGKSLNIGYFRSHNHESDYENLSLNQNHEAEGLSNVASFGIFDGYKGTFTSDLCAKELHANIIDNFMHLSAASINTQGSQFIMDDISSEDKIDAILCQSIRQGCTNMDEFSRRVDHGDSGSCGISIFLLRNDNGSTRVICANIGDSRCVLYGKHFANARVLPFEGADRAYIDDDPTALIKYSMNAYRMSEDHSLSCLRERSRVLGKTRHGDNSWMLRPLTTNIALPAAVLVNEHGIAGGVSPMFELGYPSRDHITIADEFLEVVKEHAGELIFHPRNIEFILKSTSADTFSSSDEDSQKLIHQETFVDNDVIIGRKGGKVRTTRAIGDKDGPRGLIAVPEMSAITINSNEKGRFVLAFKSFWDCISDADIMAICKKKVLNPKDLARELGWAAELQMKERGHVKELCIVVVDLNPAEQDAEGERSVCACVLA